MSKKYSPIRISDPHEGHTVPLLPTQNFSLYLSGDRTEVEFDSPFFELLDSTSRHDVTIYNFAQKYDLSYWSRVSKVFLGEVVTLSQTHMGSLCVFLSAADESRSNYTTVVNPEINFVKLEATTILEVVVYDKDYLGRWDCAIISGEQGLKYEQLEYRQIDPRPGQHRIVCNDPYVTLPRADLFDEQPPMREHHYWFRLDTASMMSAVYLPTGTYATGKIVFDFGDKFKVLNTAINIRANKKKIFEKTGSMTIVMPEQNMQNRIRKYIPQMRDSLYRAEICFKKKECDELHSERVVYF